MERPPEYVMILFSPCNLSLTPDVHGEEVPFHCLLGLFFLGLHCIWTSLSSLVLSSDLHLTLGVCFAVSMVAVLSVTMLCFHKMELFAQKRFPLALYDLMMFRYTFYLNEYKAHLTMTQM